jgi:hypothetical protein
MAGARKLGSQNGWREGINRSLGRLTFMTVETFACQELWQPAQGDKRPDAAVLVRACAVRRTKSRKGRKGAQLAEMGPKAASTSWKTI